MGVEILGVLLVLNSKSVAYGLCLLTARAIA